MAVTLTPVPRFPMVRPGDDLAALLIAACEQGALAPADGDVVVVAQKIVSKAEGRYVDLAQVRPSAHAESLAAQVDKDPRLVEVILSESQRVVRHRPGVLIVEHRLGFIMANAGVDRSAPSRCCCCRAIRMPRPRACATGSARTSAAGPPS